jgi:hypothetical protein
MMEIENPSAVFPVETNPATFGPTGERDLARLLNDPRACDPRDLLAALVELAHRIDTDAARIVALDTTAGRIETEDGTHVWVAILQTEPEVTEDQVEDLWAISDTPEVLLMTAAPLHPRAAHHISCTPGFEVVQLTAA